MKSFRNKIVATLIKNNKRKNAELSTNDEYSFLFTISAELKMINSQLDAEKKKLIEEQLNELPSLQREALLLYFYEGLKYEQIADLIGIKTKSSRALIYRGLQSLREHLSPHKGIAFLAAIFMNILT